MSLINLFVAARNAWSGWRARQRAYGELMMLDDRSLADIGVRRFDIPAIVEGFHENARHQPVQARDPPTAPRARQGKLALGGRVVPRDPYRLGIDIAGDDSAVQPFGGGDRENAAAAANVERPAETPAPREFLHCQQTTTRRGMLTGAEGGCRVDFDRDRRGGYPS